MMEVEVGSMEAKANFLEAYFSLLPNSSPRPEKKNLRGGGVNFKGN